MLAPPAENGLAILLMAVLGAKEYFGGTEAGTSGSYKRGVGEGDNAAQGTTCGETFRTLAPSAAAQSPDSSRESDRSGQMFSSWKAMEPGASLHANGSLKRQPF